MAALKAGSKAPDFTLQTGDGKEVSLKNLKGRKAVLYFYPKDNTPGCTKEACAFNDSVASHKKFADKYGLTFLLLSDEKKEMIKKYGVWKEKSLYGKKFMGIERTTFVIDEHGVIVKIFPKVKVDGHVDEVLEALAGI
jgi:peroxiredoxin Q/BCP